MTLRERAKGIKLPGANARRHQVCWYRCALNRCELSPTPDAPYTSTVIPGYTIRVKTAISLPDDTFDLVSQRARDLGVSRSEFFTRAAQRYLDELDSQSLTGQIDHALAHLSATDAAQDDAVAVGHRVLDAMDDEW